METKIKTLNYEEAIKLMKKLCGRRKEPDVAVFVDRGWGDKPVTFEIIRDGNGQEPFAEINEDTFKKLREKGILGGNTLITYKARKIHPFLNGKKDESKKGDTLHRGTKEEVLKKRRGFLYNLIP